MTEYRGLAADSRDVRPGFLFAALPGTKVDGAKFMADAVRRGAIAILGAPEAKASAQALGVDFLADPNPRLGLARLAAAFYAAQPAMVAAVTGTSGKTSVADFLRQIWTILGKPAASLGTLGVIAPGGTVKLHHTTPDPVEIHAQLARLKQEGVDHLAMEASSHGLDQFRLDGVRIAAAGFTNLTRDHMDYHPDLAHYENAKLRLFNTLVKDGGVAVVNVDAPHAEDFVAAAEARSLRLLTVGERGAALRLVARKPQADGQVLTVRYEGRDHTIALPLAGLFQASNALVAAGLAIGLGDSADSVFAALGKLKGAPGRLELVARTKSGAPIYIDYAHKPDALETVLSTLRPHVQGKLILVFGCGGDRDRGKRPIMGEIATRLADEAIVTDDNPRSEDAALIRREILQAAPRARDIGDRAQAIGEAVAMLGAGDVLVIAGKGHEDYQIVGTVEHSFSDRAEATKAVLAMGGTAA